MVPIDVVLRVTLNNLLNPWRAVHHRRPRTKAVAGSDCRPDQNRPNRLFDRTLPTEAEIKIRLSSRRGALTLIRKGEEGRAWRNVARSDIIVDWTGQRVDESILLGSTID